MRIGYYSSTRAAKCGTAWFEWNNTPDQLREVSHFTGDTEVDPYYEFPFEDTIVYEDQAKLGVIGRFVAYGQIGEVDWPFTPTVPGKYLLTEEEVADHLAVSVYTLQKWREVAMEKPVLRSRYPRWYKADRKIRYVNVDVRGWLLKKAAEL